MKIYSNLLLYLMQLDLNYIRNNDSPRVKQLEECYEVVMRYWSMVRARVANYRFDSVEEEIEFFKMIKPQFTSQIEYYGFLYHLEIFRPVNELEQKAFYQKECSRLEKFIKENSEFYNYYKSNSTEKDATYFLRCAYEFGNTMNF